MAIYCVNFGVNFIVKKFCMCKKMTNIRYGVACFCQNSTDVILTKHKQGVEFLTSLNFLYHKECSCLFLLAGRKCQAGVCWGHWGGVWGGGFLSYIHIFTTFVIFAMAKTLKSMRRWLFIFVRLICSDCHHLCNLCNCKKKQGVWEGVTLLPFIRLICSDSTIFAID